MSSGLNGQNKNKSTVYLLLFPRLRPPRLSLQRAYLGARASTPEARAISIATIARENCLPPKAAPTEKSSCYLDGASLRSHCQHILRAYFAGSVRRGIFVFARNLSDTQRHRARSKCIVRLKQRPSCKGEFVSRRRVAFILLRTYFTRIFRSNCATGTSGLTINLFFVYQLAKHAK